METKVAPAAESITLVAANFEQDDWEGGRGGDGKPVHASQQRMAAAPAVGRWRQ